MLGSSGNKHMIPVESRAFTDNPNTNNFYYRESEVHAKVQNDKNHLRDNQGPGDTLYHDVHHPLCYCEEHQQKAYVSDQNKMQRRFPLLKEYAQIKQNMDIEQELDVETSGGLSGFKVHSMAIGEQTTEGIPEEHFNYGESGRGTINQEGNLSSLTPPPNLNLREDNRPSSMGQRAPFPGSNDTFAAPQSAQANKAGFVNKEEQNEQVPTTLIHNPTINQQIRSRCITKTKEGLPVINLPKKTFEPASKAQSKQNIKNDKFTMYQNPYNTGMTQKMEDAHRTKNKMLSGTFKNSYNFDNQSVPDWTLGTRQRKEQQQTRQYFKRNTLKNTADKFMTGYNGYGTFLGDRGDMAKLSILTNYKNIMKIMNSNYVKSFEMERKYRNRDEKDCLEDEDFAKYNYDKKNTQTMATILKTLNSPRRKGASASFKRQGSNTSSAFPGGRDLEEFVSKSQNYPKGVIKNVEEEASEDESDH